MMSCVSQFRNESKKQEILVHELKSVLTFKSNHIKNDIGESFFGRLECTKVAWIVTGSVQHNQ